MPDLENGAMKLVYLGQILKSEITFFDEKSQDDLIAYLNGKPELAVISDLVKEVRGGPWSEISKATKTMT